MKDAQRGSASRVDGGTLRMRKKTVPVPVFISYCQNVGYDHINRDGDGFGLPNQKEPHINRDGDGFGLPNQKEPHINRDGDGFGLPNQKEPKQDSSLHSCPFVSLVAVFPQTANRV
jgi:hypothetical protein